MIISYSFYLSSYESKTLNRLPHVILSDWILNLINCPMFSICSLQFKNLDVPGVSSSIVVFVTPSSCSPRYALGTPSSSGTPSLYFGVNFSPSYPPRCYVLKSRFFTKDFYCVRQKLTFFQFKIFNLKLRFVYNICQKVELRKNSQKKN